MCTEGGKLAPQASVFVLLKNRKGGVATGVPTPACQVGLDSLDLGGLVLSGHSHTF